MGKPTIPSANSLLLQPTVHAELERLGTPRTFRRGVVIFAEGDPPRGVYVIKKGNVRLLLHNDGGGLANIRDVGPGGVIGLPAALGNKPYSLTAETHEATHTVFISRQNLLEFLRDNPAICLQLLGTLSAEVRSMRGLMAHPKKPAKVD